MSIDLSKDSPDSQTPQPAGHPPAASGGSKKGLLAVVVVVVALAAVLGVYYYVAGQAETKAVASYSLLMDELCGPGNWTTGGYGFSLAGKTLVAKNVEIRPAGAPEGTRPIKIGAVEIENGLLAPELSELLALAGWQSQPDKHLVDRVTLRDVSMSFGGPDEGESGTIGVAEAELGGLDLVAAGASNSPGALGFIKSVRVGSLGVKNFSLAAESGAFSTSVAVGQIQNSDLRAGQDVESLGEAVELLLSVAMKTGDLRNLAFSFKNKESGETVEGGVGRARVEDKGKLKAGLYALENVSLTSGFDGRPFAVGLAGLTIRNIDLTRLYERFLASGPDAVDPADPWELLDSGEMVDKLAGVYRYSDVFTLPYSVDSAEMTGLTFTYKDKIKLGLARITMAGPVRAGQLAPSLAYSLEGLTAELPDDAGGDPEFDELAGFVRDFGMSKFNASYQVSSAYDERTGVMTNLGSPLLGVDDLAEISGGLTVAGLSQKLVDELDATKLDSPAVLFIDGVTDVGVTHLRIQLDDRSLVDRIIAVSARRDNMDAEEFRRARAGELAGDYAQKLSAFTNAREIGAALAAFVMEPKSIVLEANPSPPASLGSVTASAMRPADFVNSLNLTLSVNGNPPIAMEYVSLDSDDDFHEEDDFDEGSDFDEEDLEEDGDAFE
ncbi:MAG: hypothetical protein LBO05_14070 [Deltaproteobacteria bacterium]|nr:hypothetical protein [Deltaproteobacteria bacterium]